MDGSLLRSFSQTVEEELLHSLHELTPEEAAVLAFLQRRLRKQKAGSRNGSGKN
jgi:DNA topoisomerase I